MDMVRSHMRGMKLPFTKACNLDDRRENRISLP